MLDFLEKIHIKRILKYGLYMLLALMTQNMLLTKLRIFGVCPMILPAVVVSVGMFESATAGVVFALILGLFADMAYVENTVLFTILLPTLAFFSSLVAEFFINRRFFAFMGLTIFACAITAFAQMMRTFASDVWCRELVTTAVSQMLLSIPFSAIAYLGPAKLIHDGD